MSKYDNSRLNETQISQLLAVAKDAKKLFDTVWKYTDPYYLDPGWVRLPRDIEDTAMYLGPEITRLEQLGVELDKIQVVYPGNGAAIATWVE